MQPNNLDFTDSLVILSHTQQQIQVKIVSVAAASIARDLNIHKGERKILKCNTANTNATILDGKPVEEVETFMYMGSINENLNSKMLINLGTEMMENRSKPLRCPNSFKKISFLSIKCS